MNPDYELFPDPAVITPHAIAFARMMFAHTAFEREVSALQDAITNEHGFGEQRCNQWTARKRPALMVKLIEEHRGKNFPDTEQITRLLTDAIDLCDQRNFVAHGAWWAFNRRTSSVVVRGATRWEDESAPPEQHEFTATAIEAISEKLKNLEVELYKLRRKIKSPPTEDELIIETLQELGIPGDWVTDLRSWASANGNVRELYLFGSRAEGTARPDSDVDLALRLMPANSNHDWALGNFLALKDQWRSELETIVGRHVSLEAITPDDPGNAKVRNWVKIWVRE